jgi:hypothetical protein
MRQQTEVDLRQRQPVPTGVNLIQPVLARQRHEALFDPPAQTKQLIDLRRRRRSGKSPNQSRKPSSSATCTTTDQAVLPPHDREVFDMSHRFPAEMAHPILETALGPFLPWGKPSRPPYSLKTELLPSVLIKR